MAKKTKTKPQPPLTDLLPVLAVQAMPKALRDARGCYVPGGPGPRHPPGPRKFIAMRDAIADVTSAIELAEIILSIATDPAADANVRLQAIKLLIDRGEGPLATNVRVHATIAQGPDLSRLTDIELLQLEQTLTRAALPPPDMIDLDDHVE